MAGLSLLVSARWYETYCIGGDGNCDSPGSHPEVEGAQREEPREQESLLLYSILTHMYRDTQLQLFTEPFHVMSCRPNSTFTCPSSTHPPTCKARNQPRAKSHRIASQSLNHHHHLLPSPTTHQPTTQHSTSPKDVLKRRPHHPPRLRHLRLRPTQHRAPQTPRRTVPIPRHSLIAQPPPAPARRRNNRARAQTRHRSQSLRATG
jgi:hypothetical protein